MTRVASLIPPINLDYRVSRLNDKDRQEDRVPAYTGLPLKERGSCLDGLVVKVEGAESLLTDNQQLATKQDLVLGSEISSCMEISPWKHSGELKEAAIEQQHNCGMGFFAQLRIGN